MQARDSTLPVECKPVLTHGGTDSTSLDEAIELLSRNGRTTAEAVRMLLPPAEEGHQGSKFLRYNTDCAEPWDGPAAIAFSDGTLVGAALDRNGLRPCRFAVTLDGLVVAGSEAGLVDLDPERVSHSGRLGPGQMIVVDLSKNKFYEDEALLALFDEEMGDMPRSDRHAARAGRLGEPGRRCAYRTAAWLWIHARRREDDPAAHGGGRQGCRLVHGRRYAVSLPREGSAACLRLLPPAFRASDEPRDRSSARGLRGLVAHAPRTMASSARQERPSARPLAEIPIPFDGTGCSPARGSVRPRRRDADGRALLPH